MHHSGGAWAETREVYGRVIQPTFDLLPESPPRFLSLGLGLGYIECLIAVTALQQSSLNWKCVSYELDPFLRNAFRAFIEGSLNQGEVARTYQRIFELSGEDPERLRLHLQQALQSGRWVIEGPLRVGMLPPFLVNTYLWDAFSQETSPELWQEDFLNQFLRQSSDPSEWCRLSSYACVGPLKRALKAQKFLVQTPPGFHGKRNSTMATRAGPTTQP
jgi:hypothetical protein